MLKAPGLPEYRADRTAAAQTILWTMAAAMPGGGQTNIPRIYRTATLQAIRKVAWEGLRAVYDLCLEQLPADDADHPLDVDITAAEEVIAALASEWATRT